MAILLENVEGIVSAKLSGDEWADPAGTSVLLHVLRELERRGYKATWDAASADGTGAPHERKRVFILAVRADALEDAGRSTSGEGEQQAQLRATWLGERSRPARVHGGEGANAEVDGRGRAEHEAEGEDCAAMFRGWPMPRFRMPCGRVLAPWKWGWEPPRTIGDKAFRNPEEQGCGGLVHESCETRQEGGGHIGGAGDGSEETGESQPSMGRGADGAEARLAASECDSRVDEVRLAGNGVVPEEAEGSIRRMMEELL